MSLLEIKNLSLTLKQEKSKKQILKNIGFNIKTGEIKAIVGESGSGKSLTALSIVNLLPNKNLEIAQKSKINFLDKNLLTQNMQNIRGSEISMIFQEPMTALNPLHKIGKQISEAITTHQQISKKDLQEKINELLEKTELDGLKNRLNAYPHELSGGQRQRVMIAMAIANNPKLLIADEPTTALDVTVQDEILKLLKNLQKKMKMSILFISHDLAIVKKIADSVIVMKDGKIIEEQKTKKLFSAPKDEYTKLLLDADILATKPENPANNNEKLLKIENLEVFYGKSKILKNLSLSLAKGQNLGIIGESGSGKTTLAQAILKLIKSRGRIIFADNDLGKINKNDMRYLRQKLQIVFQDPFSSLNPKMCVYDLIAEGLRAHKLENEEKIIDNILKEVELPKNCKNLYPHEFSGGQRQRIAIARSLVLNPDLIIFDEPTSALDVTTQKNILNLLLKLQKNHGMSYIFISHDLKVIQAMSDEILVLKDGDIIEYGKTAKIITNPKEDYTKNLLQAAI